MKRYKTIIITAAVTGIAVLGTQFLIFRDNIGKLLKINQVLSLLKDDFYFDVDENKLTDYALAGMAVATDDPYTNYYSSEQFGRYLGSSENSYIGIGVVIGIADDGESIKVVSVMENSPGENAGLLAGDIILEINGEKPESGNLNSAADKLKGNDIGSEVMLKVRRGNEKLNITVHKDSIEKDTVTSKLLSDSIGYIRISAFDRRNSADKNSEDTYDEFKAEIDSMQQQGIKKLVLDLRDNPGGDVKVVSEIADYILPKGVITYTEDKHGKRDYIYSDENCIDMDMAVLVNGSSASASEILTGALKDYNKAKVVGTKTYGKGIVQTIFHLKDGSGISITTSKYYTPNGVCIHGIGIEPDYNVPLPEGIKKQSYLLEYDEDTQLQKAVEILK